MSKVGSCNVRHLKLRTRTIAILSKTPNTTINKKLVNTINKKPIHTNKRKWIEFNAKSKDNSPVTPSSINNIMLDNACSTMLEIKSKKRDASFINQTPFSSNKKQKTEHQTLNILFEAGNRFERRIIEKIKKKFPKNVAQVVEPNKKWPTDNSTTFKYMLEGIPFIFQAILFNKTNGTWGVADLLVRSDWINKIIDSKVLSPDMEKYKAPLLNGNYHYIIIDIKYSNLDLKVDGLTMQNSNRMPACKGQLTIYNAILGQLQGYTPSGAYLLGKSWSKTVKKVKSYGNNPFDKLGVVDYDGEDSKYIKLTRDAIDLLRKLRNESDEHDIYNPTMPELIPNTTIMNDVWYSKKMDIATKMESPILICNVGIKHAKTAFKKGITSYKNPKLNAEVMGFKKDGKNGKKVDAIININRDSKELIKPKFISNNDGNWQEESELDFYIDFETVSLPLYDDNLNGQLLIMIGMWYKVDGAYQYTSFVVNDITNEEEYRIVNEFVDKINTISKNHNKKPKLFYWSKVEQSIIKTLNDKYEEKWLSDAEWLDMHKLFEKECIVINGVLTWKLKDVAKGMKKLGMIQTNWLDNGIDNGYTAMMEAIRYYKQDISNRDNDIIVNITNYNEADCKVVWEIVHYLRMNHVK
jgi:hypothetical protein